MNSKIIVTKEQVEENMKDVLCRTEMEWNHPVTYVSVRMKNGFVVRASTTCVDPANYDEEYGKQICLEKIEDKIWELLGYALQEKIYRVKEKNKHACVSGPIRKPFKEDGSFLKFEDEESKPEFPKFITGGLYLLGVKENGNTAMYYRSRLTGAWEADVTYEGGKLILEVPGIIKPKEVFPISLEEFMEDNCRDDNYSLEELTDGKWTEETI